MAREKVETPVSTVLKQAVQRRLQAKQNICALFSLFLFSLTISALAREASSRGDAWMDAVFTSGIGGG